MNFDVLDHLSCHQSLVDKNSSVLKRGALLEFNGSLKLILSFFNSLICSSDPRSLPLVLVLTLSLYFGSIHSSFRLL